MPPSKFSTRKLALSGLARKLRTALPARVVIAGGPRSGKSHLAKALAKGDRAHHGTDELEGLGWSDSSLAASKWLSKSGPWICEGVMMPRALRKWLARRPKGSPADLVIWINEPVVTRSRGQHVMAAGCETVWRQVRGELRRRSTRIIEM